MNSKAIKRQLLAAIAMVLVAAIALGSSTYAWFVASGTVKAEGMKVQAQAESGILIKEKNNGKFGTVATVNAAAAKLYPTSTTDLTKWYHAVSQKADDAESKQDTAGAYTKLEAAELKDYRLVNQFVIRSATDTAISNAKLQIKDVTVSGKNATEYLNKSIRVGIKVSTGGAENSATYIYAPKADSVFTLTAVYDNNTQVTENNTPTADDFLTLASDTIPANDTGLIVDVFVWYEGEDEECKTSNIISSTGSLTPDELSVSVEFVKADIVKADI